MSLPQYPDYSESNVDWIGRIPSHWETRPLKFFTQFVNGMAFKPADWKTDGVPIIRIENLNESSNFNYYDGDVPARYFVQKGDLLFGWSGNKGTSFGPFLWWREGRHYLNQHIFKLDPIEKHDKFWLYWTLKAVTKSIEEEAHGIIGMVHVTKGKLGGVKIPVIPKVEQIQIARFLNHETSKIDALIREQERLIALLQEKRQAVISHAVTEGMDPNVPMNDSGVEWLGEVPAHWRVGKLRWYATIQGGVAKGKDYQDQKTVSLPYLRVANVQAGYVDLTEMKEIAVLESEVERYSLRHGDVLMNEGGDNNKLGRGTVWKAKIEPCLHQNHVFAIRPSGHLTPEWLAMFTQSSRARSYFFLNSKQSTNLASISSSNVMNLDLPMPSVDEQERILQFLESELQQFTDLQRQADKGIQLLLERRSALISAAVTGKIDVRNWQPPADESAFDEDARQAGMEATA